MFHLKDVTVRSARLYGDCVAFQLDEGKTYRKWTYKEVRERVDAVAAHLLSLGLKKGDRIAIQSENRPEWGMAYLGILAIGAIAVPLDILLERNDLLPLLEDCQASAIFRSDRSREQSGEGLVKIEIKMEDVLGLKPAGSPPEVEIDDDDLVAIIYTSGTTGRPKGIMISNKNFVSTILLAYQVYRVGPGDVFISILPMHHLFEGVIGFLGPYYCGSTITYLKTIKSTVILDNLKRAGVTILCGVPLLFKLFYEGIMRELEAKGRIVKTIFSLWMFLARLIPSRELRRKFLPVVYQKFGGKMRFCPIGGAPVDPKVLKDFDLFGIVVLQGYGLTEATPIITCNREESNRIGSAGPPIPGIEMKIADDGEILARGPNIMRGYYKRPDLTAEVIKDGWLHTGDMGRLDKDGFLYVIGRIKDMIVSGAGVNIYPEELEFAIEKFPGVKEVAVIGAPIKQGLRAGCEEVWAVIFPNLEYFDKKKIADPEKIEGILKEEIEKLNQQVPDYKRIAKVIIRKTGLPKTTTRKIKKFQLKKEMGLT